MNLHQWRKQVKEFNESFKNHEDIRRQWTINTRKNIHRFHRSNSIWALEWKYYKRDEKAMVLVGSSPCLARDVDALKELDDNFRIVCANSALKFLLRHGIKPNYCISLDSDEVDIPQHLDCDNKDITLLASSASSPKSLAKWKGPIYFLPYYSVKPDLRLKVKNRLGKAVHGGGNSITEALWIVSVIFGSKTVMFVGNEYCFDDVKNYYADKKAAKQEVLKMIYPIKDVLGRDRWTLPAHYNYATWTEKVCNDLSPPGFFIDTSFGLLGKDCPSIHVMEITEAIKKVKAAFATAKRLNNAKTNDDRMKIIERIMPKNEQSQVHHYNMQEHRERLLQLVRS